MTPTGPFEHPCRRRAVLASGAGLALGLALRPARAAAGEPGAAPEPPAADGIDWAREAVAMSDRTQAAFWRPGKDGAPGLYAADRAVSDAVRGGVAGRPELWGFTLWASSMAWHSLIHTAALAPAAERDRRIAAVRGVFEALERYWNPRQHGYGCWLHGGRADGPEVYYDDNAWMVIALVDAHALEGDRRYLDRAEGVAERLLWAARRDDDVGGIPWVMPGPANGGTGGGRNACTNAASAVAMLRLHAALRPRDEAAAAVWLVRGRRLADWVWDRLLDADGLVMDGLRPPGPDAGRIDRTKWTYNTGTLLRAYAMLHAAGGPGAAPALDRARRLADAATDRSGALYDQAAPDPARRFWRDSTFFGQHLGEGLAELARVTGGSALGGEVRRHAEFVRAEVVDADGLSFRNLRLWAIDDAHAARWKALQPRATAALAPDPSERSTDSADSGKPVRDRPLVKTLLGCAGAAKLFAAAAVR